MPKEFEDLCVVRKKTIRKIIDWLSDPRPEYRLWSLVGTAGSGKSWLMTLLYKQLFEDQKYLIVWLNLSQNKPSANRTDLTGNRLYDMATPDDRQQWLGQSITRLSIPLAEKVSNTSFDPLFAEFVRILCEEHNPKIPVLLVDGYDEADEEQRKYLQEHILSSFWHGNCTRILVARRDFQELPHSLLSWNEYIEQLPSFDESEQQEQVERYQAWVHDDNNPIDFSPTITSHLSVNPLINRFLLDRAAAKYPKPLAQLDLDDCLREVIRRVNLSERGVEKLRRIGMRLDDTWTTRHLQRELQLTLDSVDIKPLFDGGIIHHIKGTSRYRIEVGVYRLLKDILSGETG